MFTMFGQIFKYLVQFLFCQLVIDFKVFLIEDFPNTCFIKPHIFEHIFKFSVLSKLATLFQSITGFKNA